MVKNSNVIKFKKVPYIIAEIGINHNGYLRLAKKMIYQSKKAGADAVIVGSVYLKLIEKTPQNKIESKIAAFTKTLKKQTILKTRSSKLAVKF